MFQSTTWSVRGSSEDFDVNAAYEGYPNYFSIKLHHGGFFTRSPDREYVDGKVNYFDSIDIDVFSIHELDVMMKEIGYTEEEAIYYHFCMPDIEMDFGLLPLGNDHDVIVLSKYVAIIKEIDVYTEHGRTHLHNYFKSPCKVVIEEIEDDPSPEYSRSKKKTKDTRSLLGPFMVYA